MLCVGVYACSRLCHEVQADRIVRSIPEKSHFTHKEPLRKRKKREKKVQTVITMEQFFMPSNSEVKAWKAMWEKHCFGKKALLAFSFTIFLCMSLQKAIL